MFPFLIILADFHKNTIDAIKVITAIMNVAFTIFAVYGIFVLRKWHRVAVETESTLIEMRNDLQEEDGNFGAKMDG